MSNNTTPKISEKNPLMRLFEENKPTIKSPGNNLNYLKIYLYKNGALLKEFEPSMINPKYNKTIIFPSDFILDSKEINKILFNKNVFKENEKLKYQLSIQKELVQKLEAYQENNRRQLEFEISKIDDEKLKLFPWLSTAIADYKYLARERIAEGLINKERPALKAAEQIKITSQHVETALRV